MNITITKPVESGKIENICSSKSFAHRALICAALADAPTDIVVNRLSEDINATVNCLRSMGAEISVTHEAITVIPIKRINKKCALDCGESGSTLRFLLPVAASLGLEATFIMRGRLKDRPLSPLWELLENHGCELSRDDDKICLKGKLQNGSFEIKADISSQFITGLLLALPLCEEKSSLKLTGKTESEDYINITLDTQRAFGVVHKRTDNLFEISSLGYVSPKTYEVEGDWSNAAFWLSAGALLKGGIEVSGLNINSAQGDKKIIELLKAFGANVNINNNKIKVSPSNLTGISIDAKNIPDLVPILSLVAAGATGETTIYGAGRLRIKESDRLSATENIILSLGGNIRQTEDGLNISGTEKLSGGTVPSFKDHRIAMTAAMASILAEGDVKICEAQAVSKSYPEFWNDFKLMGGKIIEEM